MRIVTQAIWEPCSKEEFDTALKEDPFAPYRAVPIYDGVQGILEHIKVMGKEPDRYRYEKCVGYKDVALISSAEANDKELMKLLNQWDKKRH